MNFYFLLFYFSNCLRVLQTVADSDNTARRDETRQFRRRRLCELGLSFDVIVTLGQPLARG